MLWIILLSGCTSDASCCIARCEVFVIWIVSLEAAEIWSDLVPSWSLHCWSWAAVPLVRTWPPTHRLHGVKYGFRGSAQTLESIYIVITYSRRLLVLAPSFLLPYSSQLWWLGLNFLCLFYILSRYIRNESAQAISFWKSPCLSDRCFRALITIINGSRIDTVFSDTWNRMLCKSMK